MFATIALLIAVPTELSAVETSFATVDQATAKQGALYFARGVCARYNTTEQLSSVQLMVDNEEPAARQYLRGKLAAGLQTVASLDQCNELTSAARKMAVSFD